jgi:hypothetical protein
VADTVTEGAGERSAETAVNGNSEEVGENPVQAAAEVASGRDAEGVAQATRKLDSADGGQQGRGPEAAEVTRDDAPREMDNHSIYKRHCGEGVGGDRRRASDNPILPMPFSQYREIAEWVAEQTRIAMGQPPSVPDWLVQYLRSHGTDPDNWLRAVNEFHDWFGWAVGSSERLRELLERTGNSWIKGMRNCRATFG